MLGDKPEQASKVIAAEPDQSGHLHLVATERNIALACSTKPIRIKSIPRLTILFLRASRFLMAAISSFMSGLKTVESFNPFSNLWNGVSALMYGTNKYGNDQSAIQGVTNIAGGSVTIFGGSMAKGLSGAIVGEGMPAATGELEFLFNLKPTHYITKSKGEMQTFLNNVRQNGVQTPVL